MVAPKALGVRGLLGHEPVGPARSNAVLPGLRVDSGSTEYGFEGGGPLGAKTAILAYAIGSVIDVLREGGAETDRVAAEALIRRLHPGWSVGDEGVSPLVGNLSEAAYPPHNVAYAASLPGLDILCDRRVMIERPSHLPPRLLDAAQGRAVVLHAMHSVVDWLAFAVWVDGVLVRSLSVSPDGGVQEDIGERFTFEAPFWAGEHPVELDPEWGEDQEPYPLPFHPLEMGEEALRALFGFVLEGWPDPGDIDASVIPVHGFRLIEPTGSTTA